MGELESRQREFDESRQALAEADQAISTLEQAKLALEAQVRVCVCVASGAVCMGYVRRPPLCVSGVGHGSANQGKGRSGRQGL